jgi:hypothetical protein
MVRRPQERSEKTAAGRSTHTPGVGDRLTRKTARKRIRPYQPPLVVMKSFRKSSTSRIGRSNG